MEEGGDNGARQDAKEAWKLKQTGCNVFLFSEYSYLSSTFASAALIMSPTRLPRHVDLRVQNHPSQPTNPIVLSTKALNYS